ncbi:C4-dicarboxylate TRAP transporter substrate-binding protein [Oscillospiraceae bacterium PP1C4]
MKKIALILAMVMTLSACGSKQADPASSSSSTDSASSQNGQKPVVLKLNHVMSNTDPAHTAFEELAAMVGEKSGGTLEIQVYGNAELGSNKDNLEQIKSGAKLITVADGALMADYVPDYSIMHGPFLYASNENLQTLYNSEWHDKIEQASSEQGIKVLAMNWYYGKRHIISKKPIKTPSDIKGMKVRVPSAAMWVKTMEAMGAVPTVLQWSEVYSGLEQGVVEAAEAPLATIYTSKLHEAAKNVTLTGHFVGIIGLEMSQQVWDSLSPEHQSILTESIDVVGKSYSESVMAAEEKWKQKLEAEGVTLYEVDQQQFVDATQSVYGQFPEWSKDLYQNVLGSL